MKINKRQFKKWIAALDSGAYKQGRSRLNHIDNTIHSYCCLVVGCKILVQPKNLLMDDLDHRRLRGGTPADQPSAPAWLKLINDDFFKRTGDSLTDMNDSGGYTFPEIATLLELVYIHKILD